MVLENQLDPMLNGTLRLLVYVNSVNPLGDKRILKRKNTEALMVASKEIGLEVNTEETKYVLLSSPQCRIKS
jgi:hypothetical protein